MLVIMLKIRSGVAELASLTVGKSARLESALPFSCPMMPNDRWHLSLTIDRLLLAFLFMRTSGSLVHIPYA